MTQELAKKLEDAGFPFYDKSYFNGKLSLPTLEELIDKCKLPSFCLGRDRYGGRYSVGEWICGNNNVIEASWGDDDMAYKFWKESTLLMGETSIKGNHIKASGSTPQIAVANLWLSLNTH